MNVEILHKGKTLTASSNHTSKQPSTHAKPEATSTVLGS